ncbi:MAG: hypothetical protein Q9162_001600 [Coniocarpon cinnabarinum]
MQQSGSQATPGPATPPTPPTPPPNNGGGPNTIPGVYIIEAGKDLLGPTAVDDFPHCANMFAAGLGVRRSMRTRGEHDRKDKADVNTLNICSIEGAYFFGRSCWEGYFSVAVDLSASSEQKLLRRRYWSAEHYYCLADDEWAVVEMEKAGVWELVRNRFLSTDRRSLEVKLKLQRTRNRRLVLVGSRKCWKGWGLGSREDVGDADMRGLNVYGKALERARQILHHPEWQRWMAETKRMMEEGKTLW